MKARPEIPASKRALDVTLSLLMLLLAGPLMILIAVLIKLASPGPAFYVAPRAGCGGRAFGQLKFRTMHPGADREGAFTASNDERVFLVGKLLRLFKLDELPQILNVLRGEMSIVGPRPEDLETVRDCYTPEQRQVLETLPGLTGIPQVEFFPELSVIDPEGMDPQQHYRERILPVRLAMDLNYVRTRTLWLDLRLIAKTLYLVLFESWRVLLFGARSRSVPMPPAFAPGDGRND